jgi:hypothetical protein
LNKPKKFAISIDVEEDISNYLSNSYHGVESGLPPFLDLLNSLKVKADFFINADICKKYPQIVKQIVESDHQIGSHGYKHEQLWFKTYNQQLTELTKATEVLEAATGIRPKMFRAPMFSVTSSTIKALEVLDYKIDSSVIPGGRVKRFKGLVTIKSFEQAPKEPYHPSYKDVAKRGNAKILEVPLTENPIFQGAPIGAGALNYFGLEKIMDAIGKINEEYIIFLIHPWELVDLGKLHPELKPWIKQICSSDLEPFNKLFKSLKSKFEFTTINNLSGI